MTPTPFEIEKFREKIEAEFGLVFDQGRTEQVHQAFLARSSQLALSPRAYLRHLDADRDEWSAVAALLTVPESYFFRHSDHLRAFREIAIPARMGAHPDDPALRVCCIGCANGEEPYTLSMVLAEDLAASEHWRFRIHACDINPEALRRARRGLYTNWALRATPPAYRSRYFTSSGNRHRVIDPVREAVEFDHCNVLRIYQPENAGKLDAVFFRNVLIYFSPEAIRAAVNAIAHLLAPGGFLFLGPAETLRGVSDDFHLCHTHETFYYQRKEQIGALIPFTPGGAPAAHPDSMPAFASPAEFPVPFAAEPAAPAELPGTAWMEEIERSSERIRGLDVDRQKASLNGKTAGRGRAHKLARREDDLQRATALFRAERYGAFLEEMSSMPAESASDPDLQLLRALAHLNRHELREAEALCKDLVARQSMNASAHYVLALCRENAKDFSGAVHHDHTAIYLDSTFAMPHMHLALIARRRGDFHTARRAFEEAILLLARESEGRLLMFGGGFSREALRTLCRRELQAMGAA